MTQTLEHHSEEMGTGILDPVSVQNRVAAGIISLSREGHADMPTGLIPMDSRQIILPPPVPNEAAAFDLEEAADAIVSTAREGGRLFPPAVTASDSIITTRSLSSDAVRQRLIKKYGEDSYDAAVKKAKAVEQVAIAQSMPGDEGFHQYALLRRGMRQDESKPQLDVAKSDLRVFSEEAPHEVPEMNPVYDLEESRVILDGLRYAFMYPTTDKFGSEMGRAESIAAADLLARYSPFSADREFYGSFVDMANVHPDAGRLPEYKTVK